MTGRSAIFAKSFGKSFGKHIGLWVRVALDALIVMAGAGLVHDNGADMIPALGYPASLGVCIIAVGVTSAAHGTVKADA